MAQKSGHPRLSNDVLLIFKMAAAAAQYSFRFRIGRRRCLDKAEVYQQTKFRYDNSIHGSDITTFGLEKLASAILELLFRFRPHFHYQYVSLRQLAKCHRNRATRGGAMTSYQFFAKNPMDPSVQTRA